MYYFWLGDWEPYAEETDGNHLFWLGEDSVADGPLTEDDGFITIYPQL